MQKISRRKIGIAVKHFFQFLYFFHFHPRMFNKKQTAMMRGGWRLRTTKTSSAVYSIYSRALQPMLEICLSRFLHPALVIIQCTKNYNTPEQKIKHFLPPPMAGTIPVPSQSRLPLTTDGVADFRPFAEQSSSSSGRIWLPALALLRNKVPLCGGVPQRGGVV